MITRGIAGDYAVFVAQSAEIVEEIGEGVFLVAMTKGEGCDDVDQGGAIERLESYTESLGGTCLESGGAVRDVNEMVGKPEHVRAIYLGLTCLFQYFGDAQRVGGGVDGSCLLGVDGRHEECYGDEAKDVA